MGKNRPQWQLTEIVILAACTVAGFLMWAWDRIWHRNTRD